MVTDPEDADDGRDKPADSGQECEGDDCLESAALIITADGNVAPLERTTASAIKQL